MYARFACAAAAHSYMVYPRLSAQIIMLRYTPIYPPVPHDSLFDRRRRGLLRYPALFLAFMRSAACSMRRHCYSIWAMRRRCEPHVAYSEFD